MGIAMTKGSKIFKLIFDRANSFLSMEKKCIVVKNNQRNQEKYPLFKKDYRNKFEIGNVVST